MCNISLPETMILWYCIMTNNNDMRLACQMSNLNESKIKKFSLISNLVASVMHQLYFRYCLLCVIWGKCLKLWVVKITSYMADIILISASLKQIPFQVAQQQLLALSWNYMSTEGGNINLTALEINFREQRSNDSDKTIAAMA